MTDRRNTKSSSRRNGEDITLRALESFKEYVTEHLIERVIKVQNGKLDKLEEKLTARLDAQDEAMKPVIETFNNLRWGKNLILGFLGFLATVGGIGLFIIELRKK